MLQQFYIFVGILSNFLITGIEIFPDSSDDRIYLDGDSFTLTCRQSTPSDQTNQLSFTSANTNISAFTHERMYSGGYSKLTITKKQITTEDVGTYLCTFGTGSLSVSVAIEVFKDTKMIEQKNFKEHSSYYIDGEALTLVCPILDRLNPKVTWSRDGMSDLSDLDRATLSDVGSTAQSGQVTIKELTTDDRGYYRCTAKWYSGNATFEHLVRIRSHLAPLWPAIGIIVEIIILVAIILFCQSRKKDDSVPLTPAPTSSSGEKEKGNRRKYATSST